MGLTGSSDVSDVPELLTTAEVGVMFRVGPKTVTRWVREGRLLAIRTPGGRLLRYDAEEVRRVRHTEGT